MAEGMPEWVVTQRMEARCRLRWFASAVLTLVAVAILASALTVDLIVIPRIAADDCLVFGSAARTRNVPPGTRVAPDSGGCSAFGCVDIVTDADRVLLSDYRRVERIRNSC